MSNKITTTSRTLKQLDEEAYDYGLNKIQHYAKTEHLDWNLGHAKQYKKGGFPITIRKKDDRLQIEYGEEGDKPYHSYTRFKKQKPIIDYTDKAIKQFQTEGLDIEQKGVIRIEDRTRLKETLYNEGYDKIVLYEDGSWDTMTTNTVAQGNVFKQIKRSRYYDMSRKDIEYFVKNLEIQLNGGKGIKPRANKEEKRRRIQETWEAWIKGN